MFEESTSRIASVSSSRNIWFIAASHPACCPAHNCNDPELFMISGLIVDIIAFPIIRLTTSPIPIGRTARIFIQRNKF